MKKLHLMTLLVTMLYLGYHNNAFGQTGIGTISPNGSAQLDITSANKGLLAPRITLTGATDVATITSPANGLLIYNIANAGSGANAVVPGYYSWNGSKWIGLTAGNLNNVSLTSTTGPAGTTPGQVIYNTNPSSGLPVGPVYWDGSKWTSVVPGAVPNVALTDTAGPAGTALGQMVYNTNAASGLPVGPVYWNGTRWLPVNTSNLMALSSPTVPPGVLGQNIYNTNAVTGVPVGPAFWNGTKWVSELPGNLTNLSLTSPTGPPGNTVGQMVYNTNPSSGLAVGPVYWDGTKWISAVPGAVPNVALTDTAGPAGTALGQMVYNTNAASGLPVGPVYWNGTRWVPVSTSNLMALTSATAPSGVLGQNIYNTNPVPGVPVGPAFWNGTKWVSQLPGNLTTISLTSLTGPPGNAVGQMVYNTNGASGLPVGPVYWDGTKWLSVQGNSGPAVDSFISGSPLFNNLPLFAGVPGVLYTDTLTGSPTVGNQWIWSGSTFASYVPTASTPFYTAGTTNDAGASKASNIYRTGKVGIGTSTPGTSLTVGGGVTVSEALLDVTSNTGVVPANVSFVRLMGTPSANISLSSLSPVVGQKLVLYNPTGQSATIDGQTIPSLNAREFVYSNGAWRLSSGASGSPCDPQSAGTISGGSPQVISGGDPAAFTSITTPFFSAGTTTAYQWQQQAGCTGSWTDISGATAATYDPPAGLAVSTNYRRRTNNTICGPLYSNTMSVLVHPVQSITGSSTGSQGGTQSYTITNTQPGFTYAITVTGSGNTVSPALLTGNGSSQNFNVTWGAAAGNYSLQVTPASTACGITGTISTMNVTTTSCGVQTAGTIGGGSAQVASGGDPAAFTSVVAGGFTIGTLSYQWQSLDNCGTSWTNIPGATAATYDPPAGLTNARSYRRVATSSAGCGPIMSNTMTVLIHPAQTITGGTPTVGNGDTVTYTLSNTTVGYTYALTVTGTGNVITPAVLTGNGASQTFTVIFGAGTGSYNISATPNYSSCELTNAAGVVVTQSVNIDLCNPKAGGTIDGGTAQAIPSSTDIPLLTSLSGGSFGTGGLTYQWQSTTLTAGCVTNWTNISGATSSSYNPSTISATTQYRRQAISTVGCPTQNSNVLTVLTQSAQALTGATNVIAGDVQTYTLSGTLAANSYNISVTGTGNLPSTSNIAGTGASVTFQVNWGTVGGTYTISATPVFANCPAITGIPVTLLVTVSGCAGSSGGYIGGGSSQVTVNAQSLLPFTDSIGASLPVGGATTYQWQYRDNCSGNWTNISGATSSTYSPSPSSTSFITTTRSFRRAATNNSCPSPVYSNVKTVLAITPAVLGPGSIFPVSNAPQTYTLPSTSVGFVYDIAVSPATGVTITGGSSITGDGSDKTFTVSYPTSPSTQTYIITANTVHTACALSPMQYLRRKPNRVGFVAATAIPISFSILPDLMGHPATGPLLIIPSRTPGLVPAVALLCRTLAPRAWLLRQQMPQLQPAAGSGSSTGGRVIRMTVPMEQAARI